MDETLAVGIWCPRCEIYEPDDMQDGRCKGCDCPAGVHVKAKVVKAE